MLRDLNKAVKDPNGNFVFIQNETDFETQKIPIYNKDVEEKTDTVAKKKKKQMSPGKKAAVYILSGILLFLLAFGGATLIGVIRDAIRGKDVQIPNFVEMTKEQAIEEAKKSKFNLEFLEEEYSPTIEAGKVISQDPRYAENYKVKEKSTIKLVVSKGQELTKMPKVVGMTKEEAIMAIEAAKLKVEVKEETSKKVEQNYVISQETPVDTELNAGETVVITVSIGTGIKEVTVVSVIGQTEENAKSTLEAIGLKVNVTYEEDTSKENGTVLKQNINADKTVEEGTTITITVNRKNEMKSGTVTVNLKSLLNYTPQKDENGIEIEESAIVKITVGGDVIFNEEKPKKSTNISAKFSAKGTVEIKVYSDGILKGKKEINMNSTTKCVFE